MFRKCILVEMIVEQLRLHQDSRSKMCHFIKGKSKRKNQLNIDFVSDIVIERKSVFLFVLFFKFIYPPSSPPSSSVLAFLPISQLTDEFPAGNTFNILPAVL